MGVAPESRLRQRTRRLGNPTRLVPREAPPEDDALPVTPRPAVFEEELEPRPRHQLSDAPGLDRCLGQAALAMGVFRSGDAPLAASSPRSSRPSCWPSSSTHCSSGCSQISFVREARAPGDGRFRFTRLPHRSDDRRTDPVSVDRSPGACRRAPRRRASRASPSRSSSCRLVTRD